MARGKQLGPWRDLTTTVPENVRRGDADAIRHWLVKWSRRTRTEAAVIIDRHTGTVRVGTNDAPHGVDLPEDLKQRANREGEALELWHNHPRIGDAKTNAIPGMDDIVAATKRGIAAVHVVDNYGDSQTIEGGRLRMPDETQTRRWLAQVGRTALLVIETQTTDADADSKRRTRAQIQGAAAHAAELITVRGIRKHEVAIGRWYAEAANADVGTPTELGAARVDTPDDKPMLGHSTQSTGATEDTQWTQSQGRAWNR